MSGLHTLAAPARCEVVARKSRFLAQATSIESAEQAHAFLASVHAADANHHCWAYRIGNGYRASDDGEPSGTAFRLSLSAIDGRQCDRVMVVVTRWFGGIKLGAGGLARAYGGAASECLRNAERKPLVEMAQVAIVCGFEHVGVIHQLFALHAADKQAETFTGDRLHVAIALPRDRVQALQNALRDATRGQARIVDANE